MKNHCRESVGFSFKATLWFPHWFCLCKVLWDQSYNSTFRLFSLSSVMILSVSVSFLFPCFLFSLLLDQIASFQLKQIVVFFNLLFRVCIYFIAWLWLSLITELQPGSDYWMQLIVWTLNMNYDRKGESNSVSCRHFLTIFLGISSVLLFAWIKAKE